jgi:hypothetical protein
MTDDAGKPKFTLGELILALRSRAEGRQKWLLEQRPQIFEEQKHCEAEVNGVACVERVYWHYGYSVALLDMLRQLDNLKKEN